MSIYRRLGLALALLLLSVGCQTFVPPDREQMQTGAETQPEEAALLRVATCWAGLPLAEQAASALMESNHSLSIDVIPTTSALAEQLVREGAADIALVVANLPPNIQQQGLDQRYAPLSARLLALDAVAVIVPKDAPLTDLSQEQMTRLFAGRVVDWSELNAGSGQPEIVVPQTATTGRALFEQAYLSDQPLSTTALLMPHDQGIVDYVAEHPNAIGYVSAAYLDERVKTIRIDGHALTRREITNRSYPLLSWLVLLTAPDAPQEATLWQSFLVTGQGRGLLEKLYVPVR
ncbi:MAG: hypothetical protein GX552_02535 [Chloroflexi bacterium]|jgi:phosphate transport system substrate-binding protein|nr:hypothetical protein [Chloroflexota bacterium]